MSRSETKPRKRQGRPPSCTCGTCDRCRRNAYNRAWYRRRSREEKRAALARRTVERVRERNRERERHPRRQLMKRARTAVSNAIRDGRMVKEPCERCGSTDVEAHHDDYSRPLDVRWLCKPHHDEEHLPEGA